MFMQLDNFNGLLFSVIVLCSFPALGTNPEAFLVKGGFTNVANFTEYQDTLVFSGWNGSYGQEPWRSDGTEAGTALIKDIYPGSNSSWAENFMAVNGVLVFTARDSDDNYAIYRTDGTETGTYSIINEDINEPFVHVNDFLVSGEWLTDGTVEGSHKIGQVPGIYKLYSGSMLNGYYYVPAITYPETECADLLKIDLNTDECTKVYEFEGNGVTKGIRSVSSALGLLFITAKDDTHGAEPWVSDGTREGTHLLKNIMPDDGGINIGSDPYIITEINGLVYFSAHENIYGYEPWVTDGTESGTRLLKNINTDPTSLLSGHSIPEGFMPFRNYCVFSAKIGNGNEWAERIFLSDGTTEGTIQLTEFAAEKVAIVHDMLYIGEYNDTGIWHLWKSDGTPEGTVWASDTELHGKLQGPEIQHIGGLLYFNSYSVSDVRELWAMNIPPAVTDIVPIDPNPTNADAVQFEVRFDEAVSGVDMSDFTVFDIGLTGAQVTGVSSGSGSSITVTVATGEGDGTLQLRLLDNNSIIDTFNEPLEGYGTPLGDWTSEQSYRIDRTPPEVYLNSSAPNPAPLEPMTVTVYFTEPVTDFTDDDPVVTNGTISGFTGSGQGYVFLLTPQNPGLLTVSIPEGAAVDEADNGNTASAVFERTILDVEGEGSEEGMPAEGSPEEGQAEGMIEGEGGQEGEDLYVLCTANLSSNPIAGLPFVPAGTATLSLDFDHQTYQVEITHNIVAPCVPWEASLRTGDGVWPVNDNYISKLGGQIESPIIYALTPEEASLLESTFQHFHFDVNFGIEDKSWASCNLKGETSCFGTAGVSIKLEHEFLKYTPGETFDITMYHGFPVVPEHFLETVDETLPSGWNYLGPVSGVMPTDAPTPSTQGALHFSWLGEPFIQSPQSFTYRVWVPLSQSGGAEIMSTLTYYTMSGPFALQPVINTVLEDPNLPVEGEGSNEGEAEGQAEGVTEGYAEGVSEGELCEGDPADADLILTRTTTYYYTPGETLDLSLRLEYTNCADISYFVIEETLPANWSFLEFPTPCPMIDYPTPGDTGILTFMWGFGYYPQFPLEFTYRVQVPADQTGDVQFSGQATCTLSNNADEYSNTEITLVHEKVTPPNHTADQNNDYQINLSELLRVIQFFNSNGIHCQTGTEDGFNPGPGDQTCVPHQSDYSPQDWVIGLSELLR
nr:Ig-like domain-containing protein [Candidatus Hydrogenedentota bacterium]